MSSTIQPMPLMQRLNLEWDTSHAAREHSFGSIGYRTCGDLLDEFRQLHKSVHNKKLSAAARTSLAQEEDNLLYELLVLARQGDKTSERVLVQVLIPVARRMSHRVLRLDDMDSADRVGYAISKAWEMIRLYKLHLRRRVHANLTLGMLGLIAPRKTQNELQVADRTTAMSDDIMDFHARNWQSREEPVEVLAVRLFSWAVDTGVLTRDETALLARVSLGDEKQTDIADELGVSVDCINQRVKRARTRLRAAYDSF